MIECGTGVQIPLFFGVLLLQHYDDLHPMVEIKESSTLHVNDVAIIVKQGSSKFGHKVVVTDPNWNGMVKVYFQEDQEAPSTQKGDQRGSIKSFLREHLQKEVTHNVRRKSERLSIELHDNETCRTAVALLSSLSDRRLIISSTALLLFRPGVCGAAKEQRTNPAPHVSH